jgi:Na+/H+ antiporter NhaD/arsenite permease-like protein
MNALRGVTVFALLLAPLALDAILGPFGGAAALVVVLPPFGLALQAFGWRDRLADVIARPRSPLVRVGTGYATWTATSALLGLDVAAVLGGGVGAALEVPAEERRTHVGAAILGSNVGSLLFPFSNLTNLVVVAAAGVGFGAYVGAALAPQLVASAVAGVVLLWRVRRTRGSAMRACSEGRSSRPSIGRASWLVGVLAAGAAIAAVAVGCLGGDVVIPLVVIGSMVTGLAAGSGRIPISRLRRSVPLSALVAVAIGAIVSGSDVVPGSVRALLESSTPDAILLIALAFGGALLASVFNNLPAAAIGAALLSGSAIPAVVAFLVGINLGSLATAHGSVATILVRDRAPADVLSPRGHVRVAAPRAALIVASALVPLVLLR